MKKHLKRFIPLLMALALLSYGCAPTQQAADASKSGKPAAAEQQKKDENVYKGKIVGKSNKAKTIMLKFDDNTKGLEHANEGEDVYATVIKPKLAQLPEGVTEVKFEEMVSLVESKADMVLIDSRPGKRYAQAHLPGATSVPVDKLKEKQAEALPKEKDKLLIFYCGGPT